MKEVMVLRDLECIKAVAHPKKNRNIKPVRKFSTIC